MQRDLDVRKFDEGFLSDENQHAELIRALRADVDCVLVEIHYCLEEHRRDIRHRVGGSSARPNYRVDLL